MSLQTDLLVLANLREQISALTEQKALVEETIMATMTKAGQKTATLTVAGATMKATVVAGQRVVIDEGKIKSALDPKTWKKVTRVVLDKDKLEAAVALGEVDTNTVAACSEVKDVKPYVKVTGDQAAVVFNAATQTVKRVVKVPAKR